MTDSDAAGAAARGGPFWRGWQALTGASRLSKLAIVILAALAMGGAIYYWRTLREIPVRTAQLESNVEVRVFGIGTVEAQVVSRVGFQVSGKLVALHADQGDIVQAAALLAKLEDDTQRAKLMKSEAALRQAAANLAKVQAQRDRAEVVYQQKKSVNARRQSLVARGAVSQEAAEDTQAAEEIARSDLKVFEADATVARALHDDAAAQQRFDEVVVAQHELRAPFEARIIARHKELGSIANAGEAVFTLIAPASIWVRAHVDEALAGGLETGQTAYVRLRSEADRTVEAEVMRIDQENDRVTEERRVYVRCRACNPQHQLRFLGEQAEVEIVKKVVPRARFVPLKVVEGFDGRSGEVWVIERGRLAKRRVQLGERLLDGRIEVASDLADDVAVVIENGSGLREGRAARALPPGGS
jgi:HlyD family secretion protein